MSADTIAVNKLMDRFNDQRSVWLFAYGSLIFKADFPYLDKRPASIRHWVRRFWQGSHDHRGTESSPGRVVTLIPEPNAICRGMAFHITTEVFDHLDYREKNGYLRYSTEITFDNDESPVEGLTYIATRSNSAFLGPAPELEIARQIAASAGPSGPNADYVTQLAASLRELQADDRHVFAVERYLKEVDKYHRDLEAKHDV